MFLYLFCYFVVVSNYPSLIAQEEVYEKFVSVWKYYVGESGFLFKALVCPRNVEILSRSQNAEATWDSFAKFLAFLLKKGLVACENLEEQCVAIFKYEWDRTVLTHMTNSFNALTKYHLQYGGSASEFTHLVGFLSK